MAKYRDYSYEQERLLPVSLLRQIQPSTFEHTLNYMVDQQIDLRVFESRYRNDDTGAPAIDPAILLKVILLAYSRGIIGSRRIAQACEENVLFMALAADSRPHFTTIAEFISSMGEQITSVFTDVLAVCYSEGLIGKRMFAVDGCKISSNCAKEWSGTKKELLKKAQKIEESVRYLVKKHRQQDEATAVPEQRDKEKQSIENLKAKAKKIREWLGENEDRRGAGGKPVKSNITDNESAKMPSSHGVIQGYNGIATVDEKHQVIVDAQAFGEGHEAKNLGLVVESVRQTFRALDRKKRSDVYREVALTADSGFHSEHSVKGLLEARVDAYVADKEFRKRDPRFCSQQEYKKKTTDRKKTSRARKYFDADEFVFEESTGRLICPAGKAMKSSCPNWRDKNKGYTGKTYKGLEQHCRVCELRSRCIRSSGSKVRQVTKIVAGIRHQEKSATQRMIERFDSPRGRFYYSQRMGTVEPVFAHMRHTLGMDRFTLRGRAKVEIQWKLYCMVHNISKIQRFATA
jgi:transposase